MKKVILAVLDGVGYSTKTKGNALLNANTPTFDKFANAFSYSLLDASGRNVGLPDGQMGNSEVGHLTIGAGRVVYQPLEKINNSIKNNTLCENKVLNEAIDHALKNKSTLHIIGLLSDGGVHSHLNHILELINIAKYKGINKLYIHVILDGRDTFFNVALKYLNILNNHLNRLQIGKIATISGRYYAMDRENVWENTKLYYDAIVNGIGQYSNNYNDTINHSYEEKKYDEFVIPTIIDKNGTIKENDSVIIANFRPDRLIQICSTFTNKNFNKFEVKRFNNMLFTTMMPVSASIKCPNIFEHEIVNNTLGEILSKNNYRVLRIAEEAKYPHVTHFFDGDKDIELFGTDRIKVSRKPVVTYDMAPEMSSVEIIDELEEKINNYDFVFVNFANGDMVGHTGNYKAAIKAVETLDKCLKKLYDLAIKNNFLLIVTADHGNCEEMIGNNNEILTTHTTNPVYFIVCDKTYKTLNGSLSNIAPSILSIMGIDIPSEMKKDLIIKKVN